MNYINPRNVVAFTLILFVILILCGSALAQEKKIDVKAVQRALSVPEIIVPVFDPAATLKPLEIDTAELKIQIEQITAKRKELAEFERHFKAVLKLKRQEQTKR